MEKKINLCPKGTYDLFGDNSKIFLNVRNIFFKLSEKFNFSYVETPIFEYSNVFESTNEISDIVTKELYKFSDKSNRQLALRPEGTAPIMRAITQHKLAQNEKKFFYFGPMFRYESPQKGRYRQFYQAGFEIINYKNKSLEFQVLEIIILAKEILKNLEITQFQLKINFLSNAKTRIEYARNLRAYFEKFIDKLEPISRSRIKNNPLRILDDKIEAKKDFVKLAPKINTFWTNEDLDKFNLITTVLDKFQIAYKIDYNLVRGLDYYDDFVFEFIDTSNTLGTKLTLVGGGCYNNLSLKFGPDNLHNIGMAFGIERIIEILKTKSRFSYKKLDFFLIGFNYTEIIENFKIANLLREQNFQVDLNKSPLSINKGFQKAKKSGARFAFFFEKNQEKNYISLKNLQTGKNCEILYSKFDLENLNYIINEGKNV
ncbi:histidine--tRNA ligase [Mesomycoplasma flocculare]|uniref:Histidine--tRNA ligase n=1 Tax=Mesomycoplasma flocculare ATCC 27399 TaxID=743971 RepID=A0A0A8ECD4_MESFC|nr:histidine--tRNA ligase [Mesomycoplasma flocculare]AJC49871.1 histidyl-tRNA synthetase [Mesomycoplasma flocculare ATCC 27399]ENX51208.1 histidyl-tRNA synthetase [Mesomycoplasma flocculare ATCC 27716]MXR22974.1 histidine--tRNA ligase [Mesomycoplasma flocculare]